MNSYKNELEQTYGKAYAQAMMKTARRVIDGKQEPSRTSEFNSISNEMAMAIAAVLYQRADGKIAINKPATIEWQDLGSLIDEYKIGTNKIDRQIIFTY